MTSPAACIWYRIWPPETHGRCLGATNPKDGMTQPCDEVIRVGKCPWGRKTLYLKEMPK
jgi:hypothetical protein